MSSSPKHRRRTSTEFGEEVEAHQGFGDRPALLTPSSPFCMAEPAKKPTCSWPLRPVAACRGAAHVAATARRHLTAVARRPWQRSDRFELWRWFRWIAALAVHNLLSLLVGAALESCWLYGARAIVPWYLLREHQGPLRPIGSTEGGVAPVPVSALPLRASGRFLVDRNGDRVRLRCVNWYGAHLASYAVGGLHERRLSDLARSIREMGFNCVRLPYSLDLQLGNVRPTFQTLAANPELMNLTGLELLDETVRALTAVELMVVLNNHQGKAMWCCSEDDGEGLWYTTEYPEETWLRSLRQLAARYSAEPHVVGYDLRNELRAAPKQRRPGEPATEFLAELVRPRWGEGGDAVDWAAAAVRASLEVTKSDPDALLVVEGLQFATDLRGAERAMRIHRHPKLMGRIVYGAHDYSWHHPQLRFSWYVFWTSLGWILHLLWRWISHHRIRAADACLRAVAVAASGERSATSPRGKHQRFGRREAPTLVAIVLALSLSSWLASYGVFEQRISKFWGFLIDSGEAPVWLGEFGYNGPLVTDDWHMELGEEFWWRHMLRYMEEREVDYAYWALNGDKEGEDETFGILSRDYSRVRHPWLLKSLP